MSDFKKIREIKNAQLGEKLKMSNDLHCTVCQPPFGREPTRITCPYCGKTILTRVERKGTQ